MDYENKTVYLNEDCVCGCNNYDPRTCYNKQNTTEIKNLNLTHTRTIRAVALKELVKKGLCAKISFINALSGEFVLFDVETDHYNQETRFKIVESENNKGHIKQPEKLLSSKIDLSYVNAFLIKYKKPDLKYRNIDITISEDGNSPVVFDIEGDFICIAPRMENN